MWHLRSWRQAKWVLLSFIFALGSPTATQDWKKVRDVGFLITLCVY